MSAPSPKIHVFSKTGYDKHHLLDLPAKPSQNEQDLPPNSLTLESKILGLTTNNLTYARMGQMMGWWNIYFIPSDARLPPDEVIEEYARIAAWGYATITASTVPGISAGSSVYGFLPIGTAPETVTVETCPGFTNQILVTDPHRQGLWKIYNRLQLCAPLDSLIAEKEAAGLRGIESLGWDALMQGLFATGYNLNRYGFAWSDEAGGFMHPGGPNAKSEWTAQDADLKDSVVVCLSGSGKTAASFAYCVRRLRPEGERPTKVVGVCSEASRGLCEGSGFYDEVVLYGDVEVVRKNVEDDERVKHVVVLDFGAREGAKENWDSAFSKGIHGKNGSRYTFVGVGAEVKVQGPDYAAKRLKQLSDTVLI